MLDLQLILKTAGFILIIPFLLKVFNYFDIIITFSLNKARIGTPDRCEPTDGPGRQIIWNER